MFKKAISLTLFFSLFLMMLTALVVFVAPPARVASWSNWTFLGLSREHWEGAHLGMGLLFLGAGLAHLSCNWDTLLDHLRDADGMVVVFTRPFFLGLGLALAVFIWSLAGMPPVLQIVALSDYAQQRAVVTYGEPPYAGAQDSSLSDFARRMGMDSQKALALLRMKNIKADNPDSSLAEIARQNGVAPGGVFEALKMVMEPSGGNPVGLPKDPPPGLGRRKLSDICEEYGLPQNTAMGRLAAAGLKAQPAWTLTDTAKANNVLPTVVYEALRTEKPTPVPVEVSSTPTREEATTPVVPTPPGQTVPAAPSGQSVAVQPSQPIPASPAPASRVAPPEAAKPVATPETPAVSPATPSPAAPQAGYGVVGQAPAQSGYASAPAAPVLPSVPAPVTPPAGHGYGAGAPHPAAEASTAPSTPPPGLEKMMLQTFCREYNIPLSVAVQRLARHHITAFGDMSFEELSLENNRTPTDIMRLVVAQ